MSSQEDIILDGLPDPSGFNKDVLFDPKPKPKIIRVLTVMAYVLSVSMAAIMLSIYYIFMWDGRPHVGAMRDGQGRLGPQGFSIPQFTESVEHHERNSSARMEKFEAEYTVERREEEEEAFTSPTPSTENNSTDSTTHNYKIAEMQQQFTDGDAEGLKILPTVATMADHSSSENTTGPRDYETLEDFSGASPFMKKLINNIIYDEDY